MAGQALAVLALQLASGHADGLGDRYRLADAACFNQYVVELAHLQNFGNLFQQVCLQGAADAAVAEGNYLSGIFLGDVSAFLDEGLVNVHLADIVYDNGHVVALLVVEDVVEKGGFSGSEVTGEQRNRY